MPYEPKTTIIYLNEDGFITDGHHAVFYDELLHGTQKAVNLITRRFLKYPDGDTPKLVANDDGDLKVEGATTVNIDLALVKWDEVNDTIILGQVKEWSFGPVSQEVLDRLPERVRTWLVNETNSLYGQQRPLIPSGDGN